MPNIASSRKRVRTTAKRTAINTSRKTRVRGFIRKVEEAIAKGDKTAALAALKAAEPEIMRGVTKGVLHKNTGSRKVSRLTKRVAKLQKESKPLKTLRNPKAMTSLEKARSRKSGFFYCQCADIHGDVTFRHCNNGRRPS